MVLSAELQTLHVLCILCCGHARSFRSSRSTVPDKTFISRVSEKYKAAKKIYNKVSLFCADVRPHAEVLLTWPSDAGYNEVQCAFCGRLFHQGLEG